MTKYNLRTLLNVTSERGYRDHVGRISVSGEPIHQLRHSFSTSCELWFVSMKHSLIRQRFCHISSVIITLFTVEHPGRFWMWQQRCGYNNGFWIKVLWRRRMTRWQCVECELRMCQSSVRLRCSRTMHYHYASRGEGGSLQTRYTYVVHTQRCNLCIHCAHVAWWLNLYGDSWV